MERKTIRYNRPSSGVLPCSTRCRSCSRSPVLRCKSRLAECRAGSRKNNTRGAYREMCREKRRRRRPGLDLHAWKDARGLRLKRLCIRKSRKDFSGRTKGKPLLLHSRGRRRPEYSGGSRLRQVLLPASGPQENPQFWELLLLAESWKSEPLFLEEEGRRASGQASLAWQRRKKASQEREIGSGPPCGVIDISRGKDSRKSEVVLLQPCVTFCA